MAWFIGGFVVLRLLAIAFVVLLIARIVAGMRGHHSGALSIIGRRFAEGELTEDQYRRMRDVLESD
jgi:uncharacterized membrane protein